MYCANWLNYNIGKVPASVMGFQSIGQLLQSITANDRIQFYSKWAKLRNESQFQALDITSNSSYSNLIGDPGCENKAYDPLDQINLCLMYAKQSALPIYPTHYSGNLTDVSTLIPTIKQASSISNKAYKIVLDKGFFSKDNITYLLTRQLGLKFIIALPNTLIKARDLARKAQSIEQDKNLLITPSQMLYAEKKRDIFDDKYPIYFYHYYDPIIRVTKKFELYLDLHALKIKVQTDITEYDTNPMVKTYLKIIRKTNVKTDGKYIVQLNHTAINRSLLNFGQMVLISNYNLSPEKAIELYRGKDVIAKAFKKMKSVLDMREDLVHNNPVKANKEFICFLSLILYSHLDTLMADNNLDKKHSIQKMLNKLKTMKVHIINNNIIIDPPTKFQKKVLDRFILS